MLKSVITISYYIQPRYVNYVFACRVLKNISKTITAIVAKKG